MVTFLLLAGKVWELAQKPPQGGGEEAKVPLHPVSTEVTIRVERTADIEGWLLMKMGSESHPMLIPGSEVTNGVSAF